MYFKQILNEEWQRMHIPGARLIPQSELATRLSEVPTNCVSLMVCHSGVHSRRAAHLKQADLPLVYSLAGGTAGGRVCRWSAATPCRPASG